MKDLEELCLELVNIPSVSLGEKEIADYVESLLAQADHLEVVRIVNNVVATRKCDGPIRYIIAGHLDTVPPSPGFPVIKTGDRIYGVGATDMKAGIAVMIALALDPSNTSPSRYLFYTAEEIERSESGIFQIEKEWPNALAVEAAILMEPTSVALEAGCQGTIRANLKVGGKRSHSARPHKGVNAIHRSALFLERIASAKQRSVELDGCTFREALSAVKISGGIANNVVPDLVEITINHRFAPDRNAKEAFDYVSSLFEGLLDAEIGDSFALVDSADGALPNLQNELLDRLSKRVPIKRAKLGWTDVATFFERGIAATNYGPGDPELAHSSGEWVGVAEIHQAFEILSGVLGH